RSSLSSGDANLPPAHDRGGCRVVACGQDGSCWAEVVARSTEPGREVTAFGKSYVPDSGRRTRNIAPFPVLLSAHIRPPWASTMVRAMDNPIPMPCGFVEKNG